MRPGEYLEAHPVLQFETNSPEFQIVLITIALVLLLLVLRLLRPTVSAFDPRK